MQEPKAYKIAAHGAEIPAVGLGTLELGERCAEIVAGAIGAGYRHIDTARKYGTEGGVGEGIRACGIRRDELFVTTKVTEENAREPDFMRSVETSLKTLGLDYVDLLLIHWPNPTVPRSETIGALNKAKRLGLTRHIGVSNFTAAMVDEAVHLSAEPLVALQVEYHPYLRQDKLLDACRRHGMILTAYCPLARGKLVNEPLVQEIAERHGKTIPQIGLRWLLQHPMVAALPRSTNPQRVAANLDVFDFSLTEEEMRRIGELRSRNLRQANPPERAPVWDVG